MRNETNHIAGTLHPAERRKQRSGVDLEYTAADLLDAQSDTVAVHRLQG